MWQSCCGAAAHRGPWWRCGCQCGAGASAVARRHIAHGLSLPGPMVCALVPLCAWRRCLLCSWGAWLVSPHWFLCAPGVDASCAAGEHGLSLHTGSSVRLSCLSTLAPLPVCGWHLCLLCSWGRGLSLHTGCSVRMACLSTLVPLCAWLVSPHWLLCVGGVSASCAAGARLACLSLVLWCVHWFLGARGVSASCAAGARLVYPSLVP